MLGINYDEFEKYGCINCGCDSATRGTFVVSGQTTATCQQCGMTFFLIPKGSKVTCRVNNSIGNNPERMEAPIIIPHPRKGNNKWCYEKPDIKPEVGEYWSSRGLGYDLSGFVKSKQAGERILEMVKKVLNKEKPDSWLDYREYEPNWIQFKFQESEFSLKALDIASVKNEGIITEEILTMCMHTDNPFINKKSISEFVNLFEPVYDVNKLGLDDYLLTKDQENIDERYRFLRIKDNNRIVYNIVSEGDALTTLNIYDEDGNPNIYLEKKTSLYPGTELFFVNESCFEYPIKVISDENNADDLACYIGKTYFLSYEYAMTKFK